MTSHNIRLKYLGGKVIVYEQDSPGQRKIIRENYIDTSQFSEIFFGKRIEKGCFVTFGDNQFMSPGEYCNTGYITDGSGNGTHFFTLYLTSAGKLNLGKANIHSYCPDRVKLEYRRKRWREDAFTQVNGELIPADLDIIIRTTVEYTSHRGNRIKKNSTGLEKIHEFEVVENRPIS